MAGQETECGSDGLPVLVQGSWSQDKLYFLRYFSSLFNRGMKNLWAKRAYVDLFAGPGICKERGNGDEFSGSPLLAMEGDLPFTHFYFNDINKDFVDALAIRQQKRHPSALVQYFNKDCNEAARIIARQLPQGALTLAFIDPWNYELEFDSLAQLGSRSGTDLIVTFHTFAIRRNAHQELEKVDAFLDDQNWRSRYRASLSDTSKPPTTVLIDTYRSRLRSRLEYTHFGNPMPIRNSHGKTIFYLLFASKHPRGLDFWEKSSNRLRSGQKTLL